MAQLEKFIDYESYRRLPVEEMRDRAIAGYQQARARRTVRDFSSEPVDRKVIEQCLLAAGTAPSGANQQPWFFAVAQSKEIKSEIRIAAEKEEQEFYENRAPQDWLDALAPLGTNAHKPFLEIAPYLIVIFAQTYSVPNLGGTEEVDPAIDRDVDQKGADSVPASNSEERVKNYYVSESVGIATGMLISALHNCGLATLTHTPSPMKFLNQILGRPKNERPFLVLVTGYPAENVKVPDITKKTLDEICSFF